MNDLSGEIAVVTGASRGIGTAIARALAERGATVVGTATTQIGARRVEQVLRDMPSPGRGLVLDVADAASVDAGFASLAARDLMPGILVNNAGITRDALLARMNAEQWDAVIETDLTSLYRTCRACVRHLMKRRGGRIVNVTSVVAFTGNAGQTSYAAAKAGIVGFTRALAKELGGRSVTVNAVAPGFIDTDMTRGIGAEQRARMLDLVPLGRLGTRRRSRPRSPSSFRLRRGTSPARRSMSTGACTWGEAPGAGAPHQRPRAAPSWRPAGLERSRPFARDVCFETRQGLNTLTDARSASGPPWSFTNAEEQPQMSTVEERVRHIVVEQLGVKEDEVSPDSSFVDDLGADSLDTVELVMALEEEFNCEIPDEEAEKITTVQEAISYINDHTE